MKIKQLFILLLTAIAFQPVFAQNNVKKAKTILNKVSKTYKGYKNIKANYTVINENPDKTKVTVNGNIWIKGKSFKIDMSDQEITCDGDTIWVWQKEVNEITVKKYKPSKNEIQPSEIFNLYEKGFDYIWVEQVTEGGRTYDIIDLVPKEKKEEKDYSKVKLKTDAGNHLIKSCTIIKKNGVKITYTINSQEKNLNLDKQFFKMNPSTKKGALVIKL